MPSTGSTLHFRQQCATSTFKLSSGLFSQHDNAVQRRLHLDTCYRYRLLLPLACLHGVLLICIRPCLRFEAVTSSLPMVEGTYTVGRKGSSISFADDR